MSADGLGPGALEDKLAMLELETGGPLNGSRVANGRGRGPQAMDDMLYGNGGGGDNSNLGKKKIVNLSYPNSSILVYIFDLQNSAWIPVSAPRAARCPRRAPAAAVPRPGLQVRHQAEAGQAAGQAGRQGGLQAAGGWGECADTRGGGGQRSR